MTTFLIILGLLLVSWGVWESSRLLSVVLRRLRRVFRQQLQRPAIAHLMQHLAQEEGWKIASIGMTKGVLQHKDLEFVVMLEAQQDQESTSFQLSTPGWIPLEMKIRGTKRETPHPFEGRRLLLPPTHTYQPEATSEEPSPQEGTYWDIHPSCFPHMSITLEHPEFAPELTMEGIESELLAIWYPPHNTRLRQLMETFECTIEDGQVRRKEPGIFLQLAPVRILFRRMVELAGLIRLEQQEIDSRLCENVLGHPSPWMRHRSLELLSMLFAQRPSFQTASHYALLHGSLRSQVSAAVFLHEEGFAFLEQQIIEQTLPPRTEHDVLRFLRQHLPQERLWSLLRHCMAMVLDSTQANDQEREARLLSNLFEIGGHSALPFLGEHLPPALSGQKMQVLLVLIDAFERFFEVTNEEHLLAILRHPKITPAVLMRVAKALGSVGSAQSIQPLGEQLELATEKDHQQTLRDALKQLQIRWTHLNQGNLAVFHPEEEGTLSLIAPVDEQNSGALSIPQDS